MRELNRTRRGVRERTGRLSLTDRSNVFIELVASEFSGGDEGGQNVYKERSALRQNGRPRSVKLGTYSSPRKNSAVRAKCSLVKLDDNTPP